MPVITDLFGASGQSAPSSGGSGGSDSSGGGIVGAAKNYWKKRKSSKSSSAPNTDDPGSPASMKRGGKVRKGGMIRMHKGEVVIPAGKAKRMKTRGRKSR